MGVTTVNNIAYTQGEAAYKSGLSLLANPYRSTELAAYNSWIKGWEAAKAVKRWQDKNRVINAQAKS